MFNRKYLVSLLTTGLLISTHALPAKAGWNIPGTNTCVGFGCSGKPKIGSDWLKERWEEIGEAPESGMKLCSEVGVQKCGNPDFIATYQALRVAQFSDVIKDVNQCAVTVQNFIELGAQAAPFIAAYYGVTLPPKVIELGKAQYQNHGFAACNVLFPGSVDTSQLARNSEGFIVPAQGSQQTSVGEVSGIEAERLRQQNETQRTIIQERGATQRIRIQEKGVTQRTEIQTRGAIRQTEIQQNGATQRTEIQEEGKNYRLNRKLKHTAEQNELDRQFQASENQKDRELTDRLDRRNYIFDIVGPKW